MSADKPEPDPIPNNSRPLWDMVIEDMHIRDEFGRSKYGTPLQMGNGRRMLEDMYQESLDRIVYEKGAIIQMQEMEQLIRRYQSALQTIALGSDSFQARVAQIALEGMDDRLS